MKRDSSLHQLIGIERDYTPLAYSDYTRLSFLLFYLLVLPAGLTFNLIGLVSYKEHVPDHCTR